MEVLVVGAGKMGLPLACQVADSGASVTVCDINPAVVSLINSGVPPFCEPHLGEYLHRNLSAGRLKASTQTAQAATQAHVIIIIVPALLTPDKEIDYTNLKHASLAVSQGLRQESLVLYETTIPVGGCRTELIPILEKSGLKVGKDFDLAFSPERVKSGHVFDRLKNTPKIVGGFNEESAKRAEAFYNRYLGTEIINVGSIEAAEFAKLIGMLYRDVNIGLVNELAAFSELVGLNLNEVIHAANTDPETNLLTPGIGVGGHCTPVYPYFFIRQAGRLGVPHTLAEHARRVNEKQPETQIRRVLRILGSLSGQRAHIMGLAFRPSVKEVSYSPAFAIRDELLRHCASVTLEDPMFTADELIRYGFESSSVADAGARLVILNTAHPEFEAPDFRLWASKGVKAILDGRNFWDREQIETAGIFYFGIGNGATRR